MGETSAALVVAVVAVRLIVALMLKFALLSRALKTSAAPRIASRERVSLVDALSSCLDPDSLHWPSPPSMSGLIYPQITPITQIQEEGQEQK